MKKLNLNENFICRIWDDGKSYSGLKTCDGEKIEVIDYGKKNLDAGPDYKDAKIRIGDVLFSGSIEIHRSMKDWYLHSHKGDDKYNDLILHVVFYGNDAGEDFKNPKVKKARSIPTVILSDYLTKSIHEIWKDIINDPSPGFRLPCYPENLSTSHTLKREWLSNLSFQRLNRKTQRLESYLTAGSTDPDHAVKKINWEQLLFEHTCEALGYSKNKEQFLNLSKKIHLKEIREMNIDKMQTDSLIFGLSGFLNDLRFKDSYIENLKMNWSMLRSVFKKEPMEKAEWNFFRLRPPNFPTLRLAYASALLFEILNTNFLRDIVRIFEESEKAGRDLQLKFFSIKPNDYWGTHYNFGKESSSQNNIIGIERINDIITNVLLPLVYLYSINFSKENLKHRVEYFFKREKCRTKGNEVTRVMQTQLDMKINSIADEQALIQLHNYYCMKGKCNDCEIGKLVFTNDEVHEPLRIILY